jgi:hypothetical protein
MHPEDARSPGEIPLRRIHRAHLAPLLLLALTGLFFYRLAFTDLILARGDTFAYFYPYWHARNAALMSGQLPLWSPNLFMGVPLLGNSQIGTFYPPNWLVAPLSPPDGVRVSILLHVAWAGIGAYLLARRSLGVGVLAALTGAVLFAFGGHVLAHVEQINQLQGLAWLPWLLYLFDKALARPLPHTILLGMALALQFFTGHTQTVFISGVALGLYALCTRPLRGILVLAFAGAGALVLAAPQLAPTLELTGVSNRRGGLNVNQATAFSFSPFVTGRGLLPGYDTPLFTEYLAYPGIIGLGLAIVGVLSVGAGFKPAQVRRFRLPLSPRAVWLVIGLVGLALAYGLYNPLYWLLAGLPGFNLFRVPARWLALFALGAAMLAARGVEAIRLHFPGQSVNTSALGAFHGTPTHETPRRVYAVIILVLALLVASTALTLRQNDGTPASLPTTITLVGWVIALAVLLAGVWRRWPLLLAGAAALELWFAAAALPYNQLVPPDSYSAQRFTESYLLAANTGQTVPGRVLSISNLLFDPGDRAALEVEYAASGLSPEAVSLAFDTVKMRETLAANQPLTQGIPSADGYDGGLLPTDDYSAFTSLLLPPGTLRTVDGRLRELLAKPECGGACIPDARWLNLMGVRYLITDKIYDQVSDGIFYDTQFPETNANYLNPQRFVATAIDVLCDPCDNLRVTVGGAALAGSESGTVGVYTRWRFPLAAPTAPDSISVQADAPFRAVTLVDTRTGDFQQLAPAPWTRVLSSDIKLYQNADALPRAFVVGEAQFVSDDDAGTEDALKMMSAPDFDPATTVVIAGVKSEGVRAFHETPLQPQSATISDYADTGVVIDVDANAPGYLVLADAYYPGWVATVNGTPTPVERADVMFRAVYVPAGKSEVVFEYKPAWLPGALIVGGAGWMAALAGVALTRKSRRFAASYGQV